jgi:hypothetical protein
VAIGRNTNSCRDVNGMSITIESVNIFTGMRMSGVSDVSVSMVHIARRNIEARRTTKS